ncbi:MAG: CPBP family intramembrane glutamic endopeptidase [Ancrocorticia sp.]
MNTSIVSPSDKTTYTSPSSNSPVSSRLTSDYSAGPIQTPALGPLGTLLRLIIAFVALLASYGPYLLLQRLPVMDIQADVVAGNWGMMVTKEGLALATIPLTALVLIWLYNKFVDRRPFKVNGIRIDRRTVPALLIGTSISLVVIVPASVLLGNLGLVEVITFTSPEPFWVGVLNTILLGFVMQGATEEFIWRGWLSQSVGGSWQRQALITSVAFGLIHIISNGGHASIWEGALYITAAGAFGFAAAALYFTTGSIWAAVGIHGGLHLANYVAALLGGGEGWTLEIVQIVLYLAIGGVVMRQFLKRQ